MNPLSAENEALAQRFHREIFQAGNLAVADEILAPDFVMHAPGFPAELTHGPEGMKRLATATRTAFPDLQTTDEDTIAQGDKVRRQRCENRWMCVDGQLRPVRAST